MTSLSQLTVEELADGICLRAGQIAAAEAELLRWIAEFDRREGWAGPGLLSCAHWLCWRTGLSLGTARERVRVARRLEELPQLTAAFGQGLVSYSKARAITRVAEVGDGIDWVALARSSSAAQLETIVRGVQRARTAAAAEADPEGAAWPLRTTLRYDEHGNFTFTVRGPAQYAPVVRAGLDAKKAELDRERARAGAAEAAAEGEVRPGSMPAATPQDQLGLDVVPAEASAPGPAPDDRSVDDAALDEPAPGWPEGTTVRDVLATTRAFSARWGGSAPDDAPATATADDTATEAPAPEAADRPAEAPDPAPVTDADALLALAQDALAAEQAAHPAIARRRRPQLTAQIDPLTGWARQHDGELLPPTSLTSVMKTLPGRGGVVRLRPVTAADLRRFDLGRTQREVSVTLRELLGAIDGERCRFPGCTRHRRLHAHHVVFWSQGGSTDFDNLVLVCARHHTLIHAQGFQLLLHADRRLEVTTSDGVPVLHHPAQPWGDPAALTTGCGQRVSAGTLSPVNSDSRLDLRYAVSVLLARAA